MIGNILHRAHMAREAGYLGEANRIEDAARRKADDLNSRMRPYILPEALDWVACNPGKTPHACDPSLRTRFGVIVDAEPDLASLYVAFALQVVFEVDKIRACVCEGTGYVPSGDTRMDQPCPKCGDHS